MQNISHDHKNPVSNSGTSSGGAYREDESRDLDQVFENGIAAASQEAIRTALGYWFANGGYTRDEMIKFLAHMTKEVITGEIWPEPIDPVPF